MGNDSAHLDIAGSCIHGEVCEDISRPWANSQQSEVQSAYPTYHFSLHLPIFHHCNYIFVVINWRSYFPSRMGWSPLDTWKTGGPMKINPSWLGESWNRNTFLSDSVCPSNMRSEFKKNRQSKKMQEWYFAKWCSNQLRLPLGGKFSEIWSCWGFETPSISSRPSRIRCGRGYPSGRRYPEGKQGQ